MIWGALAGLAGSAITTIIGQKAAADKYKEGLSYLNGERKDLDNWYWNTKGDQLQRADMQELGRQVRESVMARNNAAENPIAGNTAEAVAAARAQNADDVASMSRAVSSTLAQEAAQNDAKYLAGKKDIDDQQTKLAVGQSEQIGKATGNAVNGMINATAKFGSLFDPKEWQNKREGE